MGGIVSGITHAVEQVASTAVDTVSSAINTVGNAVGSAVQSVVNNPVQAIVTVGSIAAGIPPVYAGALGGAAGAASNGGDIVKGALTGAAMGGAAGVAGGAAGNALADSGLGSVANTALQGAAAGAAAGGTGAFITGTNLGNGILNGALTGGAAGGVTGYVNNPTAGMLDIGGGHFMDSSGNVVDSSGTIVSPAINTNEPGVQVASNTNELPATPQDSMEKDNSGSPLAYTNTTTDGNGLKTVSYTYKDGTTVTDAQPQTVTPGENGYSSDGKTWTDASGNQYPVQNGATRIDVSGTGTSGAEPTGATGNGTGTGTTELSPVQPTTITPPAGQTSSNSVAPVEATPVSGPSVPNTNVVVGPVASIGTGNSTGTGTGTTSNPTDIGTVNVTASKLPPDTSVVPTPLSTPTQTVIPDNTSKVASDTANTTPPIPIVTPTNTTSPDQLNYVTVPSANLPGINVPTGLNPGWISPVPYWQQQTPAQSQYYWGMHPYQPGPTFNPQLYNTLTNAPAQPWGVKEATSAPSAQDILSAMQNYYPELSNTVSAPIAPK